MDTLLKTEMGAFDRIYATPQPSKSNPYLLRLFAQYLEPDQGIVRFLSSYQVLVPWLRRIFRRERSVWSQHWLQFSSFPTFIRTNFRLLASALFFVSGGRILWTIHNEQPHSGKFIGLNQWYSRQLSRFVHRFHVHHEKAAELVQRQFGVCRDRIVVLPHPAYVTKPISIDAARAGLEKNYGVPADSRRLFLMFGFIGPYKGVDEVIALVEETRPKNLLLLIAGPVAAIDKPYVETLKGLAKNADVKFVDKFIPEEDVNLFFCAADKVIFNHRRSLTSGAMQLANDYGCNIIAPEVDAVSAFSPERITVFRSTDELAKLIAE